jgi:hypothetical protein
MAMKNLAAMICLIAGCNAKQTTSCEDPQSSECPTSPSFGASASEVKVTSIRPLVAKPGQEVTVTGAHLDSGAVLRVGDQAVSWTSADGATAKFKMPVTHRPGAFAISVGRKDQFTGSVDAAAKLMLADSAGDALPIYMATEGEVCKGIKFRDANGDQKTGSKDCGASDINPWDLRAGVIAGGKMGMLKVNCRNRANLSVFDIDQGQAAITAAQSSTITINSHGLVDGTLVRINFSSAPDGLSNGMTYVVQSATDNTLELWDDVALQIVTIGAHAGANVKVYRWQDGTADIWDTIDDYNKNNLFGPLTGVPGWENFDCGGVESFAGDGHVLKDVTTSDGLTPSICAELTAANCTMQDKITGLWWSKQANFSWNDAINYCDALNHNGAVDWRLPTQKELLDAYNHGIRSAESNYWIDQTNMNSNFWSATTDSSGADSAWAMNLANGLTGPVGKISPSNVVCVRP